MGTSLDCHDFSNVVESGFATSSARSLGTSGLVLAGPSTCAPPDSLGGLETGLLLQWMDLHCPSPCHCLLQLEWCEPLPLKIEAKMSLSTAAFSVSCVNRSLVSLQSGPTLPLFFLSSLTYLQKLFLLTLISLARFIPFCALAFLTWFLTV